MRGGNNVEVWMENWSLFPRDMSKVCFTFIYFFQLNIHQLFIFMVLRGQVHYTGLAANKDTLVAEPTLDMDVTTFQIYDSI